ncbi:MAG: glycosyltransferase family 9 protein [Paludibacteraceae bacterium]|nr:glycosyltransferase family 9 protein [Paludibacteraceae bacterium]
MTYLIIRLATLGNVAMTVPVVASLSRRYPNDRFILASKKDLSAMFASMPNVEFREVDNHLGWKGVIAIWHAWKDEIDAVIDLQAVLRTKVFGMLMRFSGKRVTRVHYGRLRKHLITVWGIGKKRLPSEFARYEDAFRRAGLETDEEFAALPVNKAAAKAVKTQFGDKKGRWIGLAPFAKSKSNMLPYRVTKDIIEQLTKDKKTQVFLFGAGEIECEMLRQWASVFPRTKSVAGQLKLGEELELMRHLDVMICMDSANQHLSSLVGLRAISVWCATHPMIGFMGWKQKESDIVQRHDLRCRPCTCHGTNHCRYGNYACREIEAEKIIEYI